MTTRTSILGIHVDLATCRHLLLHSCCKSVYRPTTAVLDLHVDLDLDLVDLQPGSQQPARRRQAGRQPASRSVHELLPGAMVIMKPQLFASQPASQPGSHLQPASTSATMCQFCSTVALRHHQPRATAPVLALILAHLLRPAIGKGLSDEPLAADLVLADVDLLDVQRIRRAVALGRDDDADAYLQLRQLGLRIGRPRRDRRLPVQLLETARVAARR